VIIISQSVSLRLLVSVAARLHGSLGQRPGNKAAWHAGIIWRLNSGVPAPDVAKWAGHSVEVLTRIYAGCVVGLDEVWIARMSAGLRPGGLPGGGGTQQARAAWGNDIGGAR
jgi:uncharacterized lipoprotein YddW (UPF0748 family)